MTRWGSPFLPPASTRRVFLLIITLVKMRTLAAKEMSWKAMEMFTHQVAIGDFGGKDKGSECVVNAFVFMVGDVVAIAEEIFFRPVKALRGSELKPDPGFTWYVGHDTFSSVVCVSHKVPGEKN